MLDNTLTQIRPEIHSLELSERLRRISSRIRTEGVIAAIQEISKWYGPTPTHFALNSYLLTDIEIGPRRNEVIVYRGQTYPLHAFNLGDHHDRVLNHLGLAVKKIELKEEWLDQGDYFRYFNEGAENWLMMRIGLCLLILDKSREHLSKRISGGVKTLQHQLVKNTFSECVGELELILSLFTSSSRFENNSFEFEDLRHVHNQLSNAMRDPLKLMGGHGYLLSGTAPLGYLSELISNLSGY